MSAERKEEHKVVKIISASRQIVAGVLYNFELEIQSGDSPSRICKYQIWERKWLTPSRQIEEQCEKQSVNKFELKRSVHLLGQDDIHLGLFHNFLEKYDKVYADKSEFKRRFKIFRENMKKVQILNENEQGTAKYGATKFADLTEEEFSAYKGLKPELRDTNNIPFPDAKIPDIEIPVEFDW